MPRTNELKIQILQRGLNQRQVSARTGIGETRLSDLCTGRREPRPDEMAALERVLEAEGDHSRA